MENIKEVLSNISLKRGIDTFLKGILTEEQEEDLKNKIRIFIADAKSDYKPSEEDVYEEAKGRGMYRYLNESKGGAAFNKGGMPMQMQMAFMEEGGLKDEGGEIDPESGNEVPSGSLKEEVRDDLPTMLSEGEFVFPADVVRYIGLEKLMMMRQEAKMGLKRMEAMGQMGNADEATIPDDLPFGMADLVVVAGGKDDEPQKMQTGGLSSNSPQFRTLESPQEVPVRSGRRNIQLPTIPNIGDEDEDDIEDEINDILDEEDDIAVEEEMGGVDISDSGYAQSKPEDKGIAKPFKQYRGEEFDAAADSYTNLGAKILSYTPLGMLSDIPYNNGKDVAKKALEKGFWSDEVLEMKNPFKSDLEPAVRKGAAITEWEKAALVKYLTVDRPKNSIFQSVSNLIGKAFGKEVKEDKKTKGPDEDILKFLKDKKLITIDPSTNKISVMLEGKAVLLENVDKWMDTWKEKNKPAPPTPAEQNAIRQFDDVGFVSNFGADSGGEGGLNLQFMGDIGGTGASRMDIFRIDDGTGQDVKFVRRYELENAGIDTSDTLAVLNALKSFKETGQIKANPIVTDSVDAKIESTETSPIRGDFDDAFGKDVPMTTLGGELPTGKGGDLPLPKILEPDYDELRKNFPQYIKQDSPSEGYVGTNAFDTDMYAEGDKGRFGAVNPQAKLAMETQNEPVLPDPLLPQSSPDLTMKLQDKTDDIKQYLSPTYQGGSVDALPETAFDPVDYYGAVNIIPTMRGNIFDPTKDPSQLAVTKPSVDYVDPYAGTMLSPSASVQNYLDLAKKEGVNIGADDLGLSQLPEVDPAAEEARIKAEIAERKRREVEAKRLQAMADAAAVDAQVKPKVDIAPAPKSLSAAEFAKKEARKKKATTGYMGGRAKGGLASMKIKPATKRKRGLASKK